MNGYTLYDYWFILYQRRKTIAVVMLSSVAFAALLSWLLPPVYQAKSVFFVPSKADSISFFGGAEPTMVRGPLVPEPRGEQQKVYLGILESEGLRKSVHEAFPEKSVRELRKDVDFESSSNFMMELYVRDRDPQRAADIANAYVSGFNRLLSNFSLQTTVDQRRAMERQLTETHQKLVAAQRALTEFQRDNKIAMVDEESHNFTQLRSDLDKSLGEATLSLREVGRKIESVKKQLAKESSIYTEASSALTNPLVDVLQRQLSDLESQLAAAKSNYTDSHPTVQSLRAQYDQKKADLSREIRRAVDSETKSPNSFVESLRQDMVRLLIDRETLEARIDGLRTAMGNLDQQASLLPEVRSGHQDLKREVDQYQRLIDNLRMALEEAAAQEQRELKGIVVLDQASAPTSPSFPNPVLNILVALGLGLVGGIFYAYFVDYLERLKLNLVADIQELEKELV